MENGRGVEERQLMGDTVGEELRREYEAKQWRSGRGMERWEIVWGGTGRGKRS